MRDLRELDTFRRIFRGHMGDETCGMFEIPSKIDRAPMTVIASAGLCQPSLDWDHVSVSRRNRTPNWAEMCQIKELFFEDYETVMQLHVPASDHINEHPYCLHLWRSQSQEIPRPPSLMVGGMTLAQADKEIGKMLGEI